MDRPRKGVLAANRWLYRLAHRLAACRGRHRRAVRKERAAARPGNDPAPGSDRAPLVLLANGRLGDALLAASYVERYRDWFGRPIVVVGRPETAAVFTPLVDRFVAFDPSSPPRAPHGILGAARALAGPVHALLGDLHVFHGGQALVALAEVLGAEHMIFYDGWIDRERQAPQRRWPAGAVIVPARDKPERGTDPEAVHVLGDLAHYHAHALRELGVGDVALPTHIGLPTAIVDPTAAHRLQLPPDYIACHAGSSQPKKDWPAANFDALFAAFADRRFVLLGHDPHSPTVRAQANVIDLRGRTTVAEALAVAGRARAFLGVDSGLAHAAALARVPTVVAMPAATPGFFFPYPAAVNGARVLAVQSAAHASCAGCGGLCDRELLPISRRRGLPCIRALATGPVLAALRAALSAAAPTAPRLPADA